MIWPLTIEQQHCIHQKSVDSKTRKLTDNSVRAAANTQPYGKSQRSNPGCYIIKPWPHFELLKSTQNWLKSIVFMFFNLIYLLIRELTDNSVPAAANTQPYGKSKHSNPSGYIKKPWQHFVLLKSKQYWIKSIVFMFFYLFIYCHLKIWPHESMWTTVHCPSIHAAVI